jgi:hypothetical protein
MILKKAVSVAALWMVISVSYAQFQNIFNFSATLFFTLDGSNRVVTTAPTATPGVIYVITNPPTLATFQQTYINIFQVTSLQN